MSAESTAAAPAPATEPAQGPSDTCHHCQQAVPAKLRDSGFCCAGCQYVYGLIHDEDLDRFYALASNRDLPPVGDSVFQPNATDWARLHQRELEQKKSTESDSNVLETSLDITNLSCAACVWLIESRFEKQPGAARIRIDASDGSTRLWWLADAGFDLAAFIDDAARFGYEIRLPQAGNSAERNRERSQTKALGVRLGGSAAFAMNAMAFTFPRYFGIDPDFLFADLFEVVAAASATLAAITALSWFGPRAWHALRSGVPHIDLPIVLGISAAWLGSIAGWVLGHAALLYFDFVAVFSTLMLAGRWVQERAMAKTRTQLRGPGLPRYLEVIADKASSESENPGPSIALEALEQSTAFRIAPGEVVPVDSSLLAEQAVTISREWITGEAEPIRVEPGTVIAAGSRNASQQPLPLRALEHFAESELAGLERNTDSALARNDDNRFGGRLLRTYLWSVIGLALGGGLYRWLAHSDPLGALQVTISVLVVSCPCALGVAIPLADRLAARRAERSGAIVRTPKLWSRLSRVRQLVFDKTGTLTVEFPQLLNPQSLTTLTKTQLSHLWQLVRHNRHPFALALRAQLISGHTEPEAGIGTPEAQEIPGKGVQLSEANGSTWRLGSTRWLNSDQSADCVLAQDSKVLAQFQFREKIRDHAREEIDWLKRSIGPVHILSGDRGVRVRQLAQRIGLDASHALGDHNPESKADWLSAHHADRTLFLGDGANDRHAFDRSLARGAPLSAFAPLEEQLDFVLLGASLAPLRHLFETAARHRATLTTILALGIGYNIFAIALCLNQLMHPLLAAIAMPISSLLILAVTWLRLNPSKPLTARQSSHNVDETVRPASQQSTLDEPQWTST